MLLSILIPSYNHEKYVLSTIRAASQIEIDDKEILVIDDGSRDGSVRLIQDYIAGEGAGRNIRLIARENRGLVRTLNEGLNLAQGQYLYMVASDDIPIADGIARLVRMLEQDSSLQFAMGNALLMDSEQQSQFLLTHGEPHRRFFALPLEARDRELFLNYPQPMLMQATVFRASKLRAMGGWRQDILIDDYALFLRMLADVREAGKDFAFCPEVMACYYRRHPDNVSRNLERQFGMVEEALAKLCPPQWRNVALFRNLLAHGHVAWKDRKLATLNQFIQSTVRLMGWTALLRIAASEFAAYRAARRAGTKPGDATTVTHRPAADALHAAEARSTE